MKFPHVVNHNGIWYPAGADVPVGEPVKETKAVVIEKAEEPAKPVAPTAVTKPTRTELQQMRKPELIELAGMIGIDGAEDMTNNELKTAIARKMKL